MDTRPEWPEWTFSRISPEASMRELARYANPAMLDGRSFRSLGAMPADRDLSSVAGQGRALAAEVIERRAGYTFEPINLTDAGGDEIRQRIRSTGEVVDIGAGTCIDMAVTVAALCVRDALAVTLALAVPDDRSRSCHAFALVHEPLGAGDEALFAERSFADWHLFLSDASAGTTMLDLTPVTVGAGEAADVLAHNAARTLAFLKVPGTVYSIDVREAVRSSGGLFHAPAPAPGDRGVDSRLPAPPPGERTIPAHEQIVADIATALGRADETTTGPRRVLLHGVRGTGKSTVALRVARALTRSRGWFLDGSDRRTLRLSLAAAEARHRGEYAGFVDEESLGILERQARQRLAATSQPWVVIVDNADGPPSAIADLLPAPRRGQALLLTTLNEDWVADVEGDPMWRTVGTSFLTDEDLAGFGLGATLLAAEARLPGVARMASAIRGGPTGEGLSAADVVRQIMENPQTPADMAAAVMSAAVMPPEHITVNWIAGSLGWLADRARAAVVTAQAAGLVEHSRLAGDPRGDDDEPRWMHRLVQTEVRDWMNERAERAAAVAIDVLATLDDQPRGASYTMAELLNLRGLLGNRPDDCPAPRYSRAVTATLARLEPLGSEAIELACELALDGLAQAPEGGSGVSPPELALDRALMYLAVARRANQLAKPSDADAVGEAIDLCRRAESLLEDGRAHAGSALSERMQLTAGRAKAMRGIMIRKRGDHARGQKDLPAARALLGESLEVLEESFVARRDAIGDQPDPERHVDRGQYNIGGACVALANVMARRGEAGISDVLSRGLAAYAGSLERRPGETAYRAASLWGVGLVLYTAALHAAEPLRLAPGVAGVEDLDAAGRATERDRSSRVTSYLRSAEASVAEALRIRARIDGPRGADTLKARALALKIGLAWNLSGGDPEAEIGDALEPFAKDLLFDGLEVRLVKDDGT